MREIRGIYFDFGYVLARPVIEVEKSYWYLDWNGIQSILSDRELSLALRPGIGPEELEAFFEKKIYEVWLEHENTDLIDPNSNSLLLKELPLIFNCPVDQQFVDRILLCIDNMKWLETYEDAFNVLEDLKNKGFLISIVSNMMLPGKLLTEYLRKSSLSQYFHTVTVSSDIGFIKPHEKIFLKTLEKDGLEAGEVLFVGDTYRQDMVGAKRVGMKTAWLNVRNESALNRAAADYEIKDLVELVRLV